MYIISNNMLLYTIEARYYFEEVFTMPTISLTVSAEEHEELKKLANRDDLTISEYIKSLLFPDSNPSDLPLSVLLDKVRESITTLKVGETFSIPDFFPRAYWRKTSKGLRLNLGKEFRKLIDTKEIENIVFVKKTTSNWAVYQKQ